MIGKRKMLVLFIVLGGSTVLRLSGFLSGDQLVSIVQVMGGGFMAANLGEHLLHNQLK